MRSLVQLKRFILCMAVLTGLATAHPNSLNNLPVNPETARILFTNTPNDLQKNDPQRKVCVFAPDGDVPRRISGHRLDKRVLKYLREMIAVSRHLRRRDMAWYYTEAWEFASIKIYGTLPPRKQDLAGTFYQPQNPELPAEFRPPTKHWPLRKIVKINDHPHGYTTLKWEMLECGHELMCAPGYNVPAKKRRCIYCAFAAAEKAVAKKRPAAVPMVKSKAVGA